MFALQNTEMVALTFLGWQFTSSLALLVLVTLTTGVLITLLVSLPSYLATSFRIMGLKKDNKRLLEELASRKEEIIIERTVVEPVLDIR